MTDTLRTQAWRYQAGVDGTRLLLEFGVRVAALKRRTRPFGTRLLGLERTVQPSDAEPRRGTRSLHRTAMGAPRDAGNIVNITGAGRRGLDDRFKAQPG